MASPVNQHCANCIGTLSFPKTRSRRQARRGMPPSEPTKSYARTRGRTSRIHDASGPIYSIQVIDRESGFYKFFIKEIKLVNFTEFSKYPITFILKFSTLILTEKNYNHTSSQSQKHSTATSQTQVSVIQSQNQQQPIVPIQQWFQHSSQPECSPV